MLLSRIVIALGALALVTAAPASADPLKCRATITKASSQYVQARAKALAKCELGVIAGKLPIGTDCSDEAKTHVAITKAKNKHEDAIQKACGGADKECGNGGDDEPLASIGWDVGTCPNIDTNECAMPIAHCHDVSECIECVDSEAVDEAIKLYFDELVLPSAADKVLNKCQQTIGKATSAFLAAKTKALAKCWDGVHKGAIAGPCPVPGDGKAGPAIVAAEAKKVAAICKACGGDDKACDQAVNGLTATFPGSGGSDDLTPAAIGFADTCPDLTVPGGPSCSQPIATLADVVECVDCITEFKVDCADALAVPTLAAYPAECQPDPQPTPTPLPPTLTPTPTATLTASPTPTVTATPSLCGNGAIDPGEECDGVVGPCPGTCAPSLLGDACTCPTGSFSLDAVLGTDLDTGWTGIAHNSPVGSGHLFDGITYGCSGGGPDTLCSFIGTYDTPFFGPPLALSSGGVPICVLNVVVGTTNGALDIATGDLTYDYSLISQVFTGLDPEQPCPTCVGDVTVDDGIPNGTCNGGPSNGSPCDADGENPAFGATSFDCQPDGGSNIGNLSIIFDDATTGTKTRSISPANPQCSGKPASRCFCDTCNTLAAEPCASNADCPISGGQPGICGGRRCLNGTNNGAPCAVGSECPGGACQRPGALSRPNSCADNTTTPLDGLACLDTGSGQGECPEGPVDNNCAPPENFRGCTGATQVTDCPLTQTCLATNRACFPDTVTRTGTPGPTGGAYAGDFCISPTGATSVNGVAGLPGLGTVILNYSLSVNVP